MAKDNFYRSVFGGIDDLGADLPWTENVANIFEHIAWYTTAVLGVTKTTYWKTIVGWADEPELRDLPLDQRVKIIERRLQETVNASAGTSRYDPRRDSIAKPYECLRRARYFSEDYLNREFDIFMSLASNAYLSALYGGMLGRPAEGRWTAHGNGGRIQNATFFAMQIDNICYNPEAGLLVANELKLGGKKNPDQILKYARLFLRLRELGLVAPTTGFALVFLSDRRSGYAWEVEIEREVAASQSSSKPSARDLAANDVVDMAHEAIKIEWTWHDLRRFNAEWLAGLAESQDVERKLVAGFNATLSDKYHLQGEAA